MRTAFGLALSAVVCLSGCAYHAGVGDRQFPGGYKAVAVPVFKNQTAEVGAEVAFTNAFVRELERQKVARISDRNQAQLIVEGSIDSIQYQFANQIKADSQPNPFDLPGGTILNTEYRILLQTTLRLRRAADQKIVWEGSFNSERSYLAPRVGTEGINSVNALYNQSARNQNIQVMAADLMAEAHDRITENF